MLVPCQHGNPLLPTQLRLQTQLLGPLWGKSRLWCRLHSRSSNSPTYEFVAEGVMNPYPVRVYFCAAFSLHTLTNTLTAGWRACIILLAEVAPCSFKKHWVLLTAVPVVLLQDCGKVAQCFYKGFAVPFPMLIYFRISGIFLINSA